MVVLVGSDGLKPSVPSLLSVCDSVTPSLNDVAVEIFCFFFELGVIISSSSWPIDHGLSALRKGKKIFFSPFDD